MDPSEVYILIVDDEEATRSTLAELLSEDGYRVDSTESGEKAISILRESSYDIIISDLVMPHMDGITLTRQIKSMGINTPIIVITAFATIEHAVESMKAGAFDFITKPFNFDHVRITINKALETKRLLKMAQEREFYKKLSHYDELTKLANYRSVCDTLQSELERALRYNRPMTVLMIDIDDFKKCNDTFGHLAGDAVLRQTAALIKKNTRGADFVARYGGEEFLVILPETTQQEALIVAERMKEEINQHTFTSHDGYPLETMSVTIGVSSLEERISTKVELIRTADVALYTGKSRGKNRVVTYSEDIDMQKRST